MREDADYFKMNDSLGGGTAVPPGVTDTASL